MRWLEILYAIWLGWRSGRATFYDSGDLLSESVRRELMKSNQG